MSIINRQRRLHEIGRIRIGVRVAAKKRDGTDTTRPDKLDTFRFTSQNEDAIDALASVHGGEVLPWLDAPVGKQYEVVTDTDSLRVLVPPESMSFSQHYEQWSGGGCTRRCDGERMSNDELCLCDPDNRACSPHSRVSVMLADLPTSGLWRVDTQSEYAADELGGAFELAKLVAAATGQSVLPGTLRLEQREKRRPGEQTKKFAVVVLDFDVDVRSFIGDAEAIGQSPTAQLGRSVTPVPRDDTPLPSISEQMHVETPQPRRRANSAAPLPATGLAPRPAAAAEAEESSPIITQPPPRISAEVNADRTPGGASQKSVRRLFAIMNGNKDISKDRPARLAWASAVVGHNVATFDELTQVEVTQLNDVAEGKPETPPPSSFDEYDDEPF